jgi:predicted 3-demethylubiquinone-9 3-methyltransferase (glyoxalase superfamily)
LAGPKGSVMTVEFTLDRVDFVARNGGPQFKFTVAISFSVNCQTQDVEKAIRVMKAIMEMDKIDIVALEKCAKG